MPPSTTRHPDHGGVSDRAKYFTLLAAFLGWMFDGFEMGLFPLIGQPALKELLGPETGGDPSQWFGAIIAVFLVGAASGGVLFGWLGDKIGRVRAMAISILTYAIFTGLCGFASEAWHIAGLRFVASLGMGGEWSLGVALVNEIWPGRSRALIAGIIGAAANVGFLLVGLLSMGLAGMIDGLSGLLASLGFTDGFADYLFRNSAWRFLMIVGAFPALLVFLIRLFVPESKKWQAEHRRGATAHWRKLDLVGVLVGCASSLMIIWAWSPLGMTTLPASALTLVGLVIALAGYLHPVRRYLVRAQAAGALTEGGGREVVRRMLFGAVLAGVALLGTWGSAQWAPRWVIEDLLRDPELRAAHPFAKEWTQIWLAFGAICGTMAAALCAGRFGRRVTFAVLCVGSMVTALHLFRMNDAYNAYFLASVYVAGLLNASFYGFFPLYLPELFPTAVRAIGQGFAYNFGRIVAAIGGLQTANLMGVFGGSFPKAVTVMTSVYLVGLVAIWFGPETRGRPLPD
jgi:SHS family sialic acid transporter-like MFS transporter